MNAKRQMSNHAAAAKMIRQELKKAYPKTKFSVTSEAYSMGNSVHVGWIDGPMASDVCPVIKKYQEGSFDGMTDSYDYSNKRNDIPQVMFVTHSRRVSDIGEVL